MAIMANRAARFSHRSRRLRRDRLRRRLPGSDAMVAGSASGTGGGSAISVAGTALVTVASAGGSGFAGAGRGLPHDAQKRSAGSNRAPHTVQKEGANARVLRDELAERTQLQRRVFVAAYHASTLEPYVHHVRDRQNRLVTTLLVGHRSVQASEDRHTERIVLSA
jgi:hypothetical protein